jgi:hypothetical protein
MGSEIQPGVMRAQKREIQIIRGTYLLIKIFKFSVRNFSGFLYGTGSLFCNYSANSIENMLQLLLRENLTRLKIL